MYVSHFRAQAPMRAQNARFFGTWLLSYPEHHVAAPEVSVDESDDIQLL